MEAGRVRLRGAAGQAAVLLVGVLTAVLIGGLILGSVARGVSEEGAAQRAADLAALGGARAMHADYDRLFEPADFGTDGGSLHLERAAYLRRAEAAARTVGRANGASSLTVSFPERTSFAPVRIRVAVNGAMEVDRDGAVTDVPIEAVAEAELAPPAAGPAFATGGGYDGPLAYRQGKPMRPDVALAFDRMERAARADGVTLLVVSGFRSDAEQAVLFARNPDPRMVARPGTSLHRMGTELDLGPASAYGWLAANSERFHFTKRYSWEAWHFGYTLNPRSAPTRLREPAQNDTEDEQASGGARARRTADDDLGGSGGGGQRTGGGDGARAGAGHGSIPGFVPERYAPVIARAAQRWNVSATLLAAQLYAESNFNPFAGSSAGAQGIAQFMPATAKAYGLENPFDAEQAIDAQGHMMRDLLRQFGSVPLALAAYNAGPGRVQACGCVPPFPETRAYVAKILGLMGGAGEPVAAGPGSGLVVRLVR